MDEKLGPCYCGGEARIHKRQGVAGRAARSQWWRGHVECKRCGLRTQGFNSPAKALAAWNRRAPATSESAGDHAPLPWSYSEDGDGDFVIWSADGEFVGNVGSPMQQGVVAFDLDKANAELIVHSVNRRAPVEVPQEVGEMYRKARKAAHKLISGGHLLAARTGLAEAGGIRETLRLCGYDISTLDGGDHG